MNSFLNTLLGWLKPTLPKVSCRQDVWERGVAELAKRTLGESRESGAYLLGKYLNDESREILEFVFYDDIDELALDTGIVTIRQTALPRLWELCRARGYGVVCDVHVHPGFYGQSISDKENPVMPRAGHIAFILPDFARHNPGPGSIGMYEFLGNSAWRDHTDEGAAFFRLTGA